MRAVAGATGTSKSWVHRHVQLFRDGGATMLSSPGGVVLQALCPPSRRLRLEDEIVWWRKHLGDAGFDAGARTIRYLLSQDRPPQRAVALDRAPGAATPGSRPRPTPKAASLELGPFRGRAGQRVLAERHDPLACRRGQGGDPLHFIDDCSAGRPLLQSVAHGDGARHHRALLRHRCHLGLPGLGAPPTFKTIPPWDPPFVRPAAGSSKGPVPAPHHCSPTGASGDSLPVRGEPSGGNTGEGTSC